ncbi:glycosyltransferase [Ornithinimicrobium pratense]|uniref:Glycosyltransferase family 1 protein n=1 Tax=Ornithinimicrobium pratense TaxID=2593973 RepID=A0A5J6V7C1_9MICO|nr:glycosyltransferase [Ornithinimicrobium pratense]QFG69960.1 glycosyltransferase family 1 protein [Ornithinimicrobium pratense]
MADHPYPSPQARTGAPQGPGPSKVVVAAVGSRGDVVPFANLAARLAAAGHDVTLVTHAAYSHLANPSLRLAPVASDPRALLAGPAARAVRRASPRGLNRTRHHFADFLHAAQEPAGAVLPGADLLIASTFAVAAVDEALRQSVPVVRAHMWPEYSGLTGPMPLLPYGWLLPGPARRLARGALRRAEPFLGGLDGWWERGRLHLVARHPVGLTTATLGSLYAFSPRLVAPLPSDGVVTGWWTDPDPPQLSPEVAQALDDGDDWIYVGFGSMEQDDPDELLARVDAACERLGVRAVVQLGQVRGSPHPHLLCIGEEPHDELFGRTRAVVHHGGAGTTGAVVRSGVPSVVVPHFADQFYWASRLYSLGVAPRHAPRAFSSERLLARRIEEALAPQMTRRAAELADGVRSEDGCGHAVRQVEEWLVQARSG